MKKIHLFFIMQLIFVFNSAGSTSNTTNTQKYVSMQYDNLFSIDRILLFVFVFCCLFSAISVLIAFYKQTKNDLRKKVQQGYKLINNNNIFWILSFIGSVISSGVCLVIMFISQDSKINIQDNNGNLSALYNRNINLLSQIDSLSYPNNPQSINMPADSSVVSLLNLAQSALEPNTQVNLEGINKNLLSFVYNNLISTTMQSRYFSGLTDFQNKSDAVSLIINSILFGNRTNNQLNSVSILGNSILYNNGLVQKINIPEQSFNISSIGTNISIKDPISGISIATLLSTPNTKYKLFKANTLNGYFFHFKTVMEIIMYSFLMTIKC